MSTTTRQLHRKDVQAAIKDIQISIRDFKAEIEILRQPQRRFRRKIATIVAIAVVVVTAFAAHADDVKQPTELQQIHQDLHDMYTVIADQADALAAQQQVLELEISRLALACSTRKPPHPPVWSEPSH